jgi:mevalonate kinase
MNQPQQTINEQYDEVDRRYTEALYAIHESRRSAETRLALLTKLQDGHGAATSAAAQLEVIRSVMEELAG